MNGLSEKQATVVLVHAAWADGSSWNRVMPLLRGSGRRIFAYECHDDSGQWFCTYGNENWRFDAAGMMEPRFASINEHPITEAELKFRWPLGRRPDDHPSLRELRLWIVSHRHHITPRRLQ